MSKKDVFVKVVDDLFSKTDMITFAGKDYEDVMAYFNVLKGGNGDKEKPAFTDNGKLILTFMQDNMDAFNNLFKCKDIADGMEVASKTVSGAIRKLVTDGYVEKMDGSPVVYSLTQKGVEATPSAE